MRNARDVLVDGRYVQTFTYVKSLPLFFDSRLETIVKRLGSIPDLVEDLALFWSMRPECLRGVSVRVVTREGSLLNKFQGRLVLATSGLEVRGLGVGLVRPYESGPSDVDY